MKNQSEFEKGRKAVLEERNGKTYFFGVPVKVNSRSGEALIVTQDRVGNKINIY